MEQVKEKVDVVEEMVKMGEEDGEVEKFKGFLRKFGRKRYFSGFSSGLCVMAGAMHLFLKNTAFGLGIIIVGCFLTYSGFVCDDVKPLTAKEKMIDNVAKVVTIVFLVILAVGMIGVLINSIAGNGELAFKHW